MDPDRGDVLARARGVEAILDPRVRALLAEIAWRRPVSLRGAARRDSYRVARVVMLARGGLQVAGGARAEYLTVYLESADGLRRFMVTQDLVSGDLHEARLCAADWRAAVPERADPACSAPVAALV